MPKLAYVDTSVALKLKLDEPLTATATAVLTSLRQDGYLLVSSELLRLEIRRVLYREFGSFAGATDLVARFTLIQLLPEILVKAGEITPHINALDSIHVATAVYLADPDLVLVTHDDTMKRIARSSGLTVAGLR